MKISEIREQYPEYQDLSDTQLADALHSKFYSDLPKDKVYDQLGLTQAKEGFLPALESGFKNLQADMATLAGRSGLVDSEKADEYRKQKQDEASKIFKPTEKGWTEAPLTKIGELAGGSLPYMAAPALAGFLAPEGLAAMAATGAASAAQFTATNLGRQVEEGTPLAQTKLGPAALASIPQAAMDVFSLHMIPGIRNIFGQAGVKLTDEEAQKMAQQGLGKTITDYVAQTGKTMGAEGLTEAGQQVFERLQAGLNINDPDARQEYFDNFLGGAVLGGVLAPAGHYAERAGIKAQAAEATQRQQQEAADLQAAQAQEQVGPPSPQMTLPGIEEASKYPAPISPDEQEAENQQKAQSFAQQQQELERLLAAHQEEESQAAANKDYDLHEKLQQKGQLLRNEKDFVDKQLEALGGYKNPQQEAQRIQKELDKKEKAFSEMAGPGYDPEKARKLRESIQDLKKQLAQYGGVQQGFDFGPESEFKEQHITSKEEAAAKRYKPGTPEIDAQEQEYLDEVRRQEDEAAAQADRERLLAPERNAMQRMQERRGPFTLPTGQISTQVDKLVDTMLQEKAPPAPAGRVIAGSADTTSRVDKGDSLRAQLAYAQQTDNRERAQEIRKMLADMNEPETEQGAGSLEFGQQAKEAGVEGRLTPDAIRANRATRLAQSGLTAFDRLSDFVQRVREGNQNVSEGRKDTLHAAAERLKDTVVGLALNEADLKRANAKMPALTTQEKAKMAGDVAQLVNELITRGTSMFHKPLTVSTPAQMRANKVVRGAEEKTTRQPLGQRLFNNFEAAAKSLRGQVRDTIEQSIGIEIPKERTTPAVRKVTPVLKTQFAGKERSVEDQFQAAQSRASEADAKELETVEKYYKNLSPEAQELVREQLHRVENGNELEIPNQVAEELKDVRGAVADEGAQVELFPGASEKGVTRTTSKRFMNFLESGEVYKLRAELAEHARVAEFQAKRAASIAKNVEEEKRKADEYTKKMEAAKKSPVEAAKAALAKLSAEDSPTTAAIKAADEIRKERMASRIRIAAMVQDIQKVRDKQAAVVDDLHEQQDYIAQQMLLHRFSQKVSDGFDFINKEVAKQEKALASIDKALETAKATKDKLVEDHAADTIGNALVKEGEKAERKIEAAKEAVRKAQGAEVKARNAAEEAREKAGAPAKEGAAPSEITGTILERTPGESKTIAIRDTLDPEVQRKIKAMRGAIAKYENEYDEARAAGDKVAMEEAAKAVENSYNEMYDALNNAPQKITRTDAASLAEQAAMDDFEEAQRAAFEADLARLHEESGIRPLKLSKRRVEGVIKTNKGKVQTAIKQPSVAEQERQAKEQAAAPKTPLEKIADARAMLAQLDKQITYIDEHKSATPEGRKKQAQARKDAVAARNLLRQNLKDLAKEQQGAVKEAKLNKEATEQLRKQERKILKTTPNAPTITLANDIEQGLFRTTTQAGPGMRAQAVKGLVDRILANWKVVPDIQIVDTERQLPERIQRQAERDKVTGMIPGVYDPNTKTVYLVAENLHSGEDVAMTIAHEVAGHFGLREMLGGDYAKTMNDIYEGNEAVRTAADGKIDKNPNLSRNEATEEVLADMAETGPEGENKGVLRQIFDAIKNWVKKTLGFKDVSDADVRQVVANARRYVQEGVGGRGGEVDTSGTMYRVAPKYNNENLAAAGKVADTFVAKQRSAKEQVQAASGGWLGLETMLVDRFAGFERLAKKMDNLIGTQMLYYLRMYDQRMNFVAQAVGNGVPQVVEKVRADGQKEYLIESKPGASLKSVVSILKDATPLVGNGEAVNRLFTLYMSAIRAKDKGIAALHFGDKLSQADLNKAMKAVEDTPGLADIFKKARDEYNNYNHDLLNFLVKTGAMSKETAARLLKEKDYIPWYRQRNGVVEMTIGNETPFKIGNVTEQPYLKELVGGEEPILDFMTSSMQNTNLLVDMALRNQATKNAVIELAKMDWAKIGKGTGTASPVTVRFKVDGEDRFALIDTDKAGVPADVLVKGMEGVPTQLPAIMRLMAFPSKLLRKTVTASPLYAAKQLFRDSLAAPVLAGADFAPVLGSLKEIGSAAKSTLEQRGITGGQVFTGTSEDMSKILRDIISGKGSLANLLSKAEALSMEADATTRRAQYNSYIKQGLSEMEATLMSLESMNFNKRGASPSIHAANALIPFFNAQIQSLNVLYKAMTGKMPFNEKLKIQEKFISRGMMIAAGSLAYAALMQDDDAYKNATPEQKYGNWFIRVPGVDEPVRLPIPFEVGYIFKALPEALYNSMVNQHGGEEATKALQQILLQTIPGGTSYGIPQALRPAIEAELGKSFYTGNDTLTQHEKTLLPEEQFRNNTTEISKVVGKAAGVSPIKIDQLVQGYTGSLGLALMQTLSMGIPSKGTPEQAYKRLSEMPVIGSAFQPNDAGAIISSVYDKMLEAKKVENTVNDLLAKGQRAEAMQMVQERSNDMMVASMADYYTTGIRDLTSYENAVRASNASPEEKRKRLDEIKQMKIRFANTAREATDRTTRQ